MRNVLLIGIGGVYNYGCEAIVRGTVEILKSIDSNIKISYASYCYEDDVKRLSDCDIIIINRPKRKSFSYHNIVRKLTSYFGYQYTVPFDSTNWIVGFDTIFSIGGDMYTLNSHGGFDKSLPLFCEKCVSLGLKYVLWGASVGKFEENPKALAFFQNHLLKADLIAAREMNTIEYLRMIGVVENVKLIPDPAYFVAPKMMVSDSVLKKRLGINLSPLSALYEYGCIKSAIDKQACSIVKYIEILDVDILLLPHVLSLNYLDNDLMYLKEIYREIPEAYKNRVHVVDSDPQFIGLKESIMKCDFVIAARMHCAVNAIAVGVPAIFLAYSEKAKGMSDFIYNSDKPVISLLDFENIPLVTNILLNWDYVANLDLLRNFNFKSVVKLNKII